MGIKKPSEAVRSNIPEEAPVLTTSKKLDDSREDRQDKSALSLLSEDVCEPGSSEAKEAEVFEKDFDRDVLSLLVLSKDLSYKEKLESEAYMAGVRRLYRAGIKINPSYLSLAKGKNKEYVSGLIELHKAGMDEVFTTDLSLRNGKNKEYLSGLIELHKAGIKIDRSFITLEDYYWPHSNIEHIRYREGLIELHRADVKIDMDFIYLLTFSKAVDREYRAGLIKLQKAGLDVSRFVGLLPLGKGKDKEYMSGLIEVARLGRVDTSGNTLIDFGRSTLMITENPQSLVQLYRDGIAFDNDHNRRDFIRQDISASPSDEDMVSRIGHEEYRRGSVIAENLMRLDGLVELSKAGIELNEELIGHPYLSAWMLDNKEFVSGLIELHKAGVKIDRRFFDLQARYRSWEGEGLPVQDIEYRAGLIELHRAGIKIDHKHPPLFDSIVSKEYRTALIELYKAGARIDASEDIFLENAKDPEYVSALIKLHNGGVDIGQPGFLHRFTHKLAKDPEYVSALIKLHNCGVNTSQLRLFTEYAFLAHGKYDNTRYISALIELHGVGIKIDHNFAYALSLEKAKDRGYLFHLKKLHREGVEVSAELVAGLSIEDAKKKYKKVE